MAPPTSGAATQFRKTAMRLHAAAGSELAKSVAEII